MQKAAALIRDAGADAELAETIATMMTVSADLAHRIARGPLGGPLGTAVGANVDGDTQKALDVAADEAFAEALKSAPVRYYASEEREDVVELNPAGRFALATDPLDGSSNIDVNVSIGTIFSIYEATDDPKASFLRPTDQQLAAGYVIYGPQTILVLTLGNGTLLYILDPDSHEYVPIGKAEIPRETREFAINASNYRAWLPPIRAYIEDCMAGEEGPLGRRFNMRWVASLVAETHRILSRGGIFLYPADTRKGYERGRLRLLYECAPIAFLVEQAGGKATDGYQPILGMVPEGLHVRVPFVFGSAEEVDRVAAYHDMPEEEVSGLFGNRGLFRS